MSRAGQASAALGLFAALGLAAPQAAAHDLRVFAWVDGAEVVVESRFASGAAPKGAVATVFDARDAQVAELALGPDGVGRFPLDGREDGLRIEVRADDHHDGYWLLTPEDIARGRP